MSAVLEYVRYVYETDRDRVGAIGAHMTRKLSAACQASRHGVESMDAQFEFVCKARCAAGRRGYLAGAGRRRIRRLTRI